MNNLTTATILAIICIMLWAGFISGVVVAGYGLYTGNAVIQFLSAIWVACYAAGLVIFHSREEENQDD